jgi:hypothetical protein
VTTRSARGQCDADRLWRNRCGVTERAVHSTPHHVARLARRARRASPCPSRNGPSHPAGRTRVPSSRRPTPLKRVAPQSHLRLVHPNVDHDEVVSVVFLEFAQLRRKCLHVWSAQRNPQALVRLGESDPIRCAHGVRRPRVTARCHGCTLWDHSPCMARTIRLRSTARRASPSGAPRSERGQYFEGISAALL